MVCLLLWFVFIHGHGSHSSPKICICRTKVSNKAFLHRRRFHPPFSRNKPKILDCDNEPFLWFFWFMTKLSVPSKGPIDSLGSRTECQGWNIRYQQMYDKNKIFYWIQEEPICQLFHHHSVEGKKRSKLVRPYRLLEWSIYQPLHSIRYHDFRWPR